MRKKRVLVGGCFDLIHVGHIRFLKKAKTMGDELWVILESDATVRKLKGEKRPINSQKERAEVLINLKMVDRVIKLPEMKTSEDYDKVLRKLKPDIIAMTKGDKMRERKIEQARKIGAKWQIIPNVAGKSTSIIVQKMQTKWQ